MTNDSKKCLHLFDFDGTLTYRDSMIDFAIFCRGKKNYYQGLLLLSGPLLAWKMGFLSDERIKCRFLKHFFQGYSQTTLFQLGMKYASERLPQILRPIAMENIRLLQSQSHQEICIVSASLDIWLQAFCQQWDLNLICTRAAFDEHGLFHSHLEGPNCSGVEKARRVQEVYNLNDYAEVIAYGDHHGRDGALFVLADQYHYRPFRVK